MVTVFNVASVITHGLATLKATAVVAAVAIVTQRLLMVSIDVS